MPLSLDDISQLYRFKGHQQYDGEAVSQLDHALQCAFLAEVNQQSAALIVACLLHDLGHLLQPLGDDAADHRLDTHHEYRAMPVLRSLFPPAVTEPIRLHVQAKRYLCAVEPTYWVTLSPASQQSLAVQGGTFSDPEVAAFITQPYALGGVQLRRWDDQAKVRGGVTPDWNHFVPLMAAIQAGE